MKQTYVVIMCQGQYDEYETVVIYAGDDYDRGLTVAKTTPYGQSGSESVYMDIWENGRVIKSIPIRDFDKILID